MSDTEAGKEFLGLAHYTEHAIYMGSENFPGYSKLSGLSLHLNERLGCHLTPANTIGVNNETKQIYFPTSLHHLIQISS